MANVPARDLLETAVKKKKGDKLVEAPSLANSPAWCPVLNLLATKSKPQIKFPPRNRDLTL